MHSSSRLRPAAASGRTQNMGRQRPEDRSGALPALGRKGRRGRRNGLIWQVCSDGWGGQDPEKGGGRYPLEPSTPNPILHLLCSSQALVAAALSGAGRRLPGLGAGTTETLGVFLWGVAQAS